MNTAGSNFMNRLLSRFPKFSSFREFFSFGLVGLSSNLVAYFIYLFITYFGMPPKTAMTIIYISAASIGYFGHKKITFNHSGNVLKSLTKYLTAHCLGYLLNLFLLFYFVDIQGFPHELVQIFAIFTVAMFLFFSFKFFVFNNLKAKTSSKFKSNIN